ncbi:MAG: hypothetical protein EOO36_14635, partial [Cytophagaceae bacterium]
MALPPLTPLPAGSAFSGQVLTVAGLDLAGFDYELVLVDAAGTEITPLLSTVGRGQGSATPGGPVGFGDLTGAPDSNPLLKAEFATYAPLDSPRLTGNSFAQTPNSVAKGEEITTAEWVRDYLATQLNLSPFTSGGGRILHVCGRGQTTPGQVGNPKRPFATLQAAHDVAQNGDIILLWPGGAGQDSAGRVYYTDQYLQSKALSIYCMPGVIYGANVYLGAYFSANPARHYWHGGEFINFLLMARQSGGQSYVLVENATFTGAMGTAQYFANLSGGDGGPHIDQFILRGCTFDSKRSAGNSAPVRNNGTQVFGNCDMLLDNCLVMTAETPCAIYSSRESGSIQALGTTEFRPGGGQPALQYGGAAGGNFTKTITGATKFFDVSVNGEQLYEGKDWRATNAETLFIYSVALQVGDEIGYSYLSGGTVNPPAAAYTAGSGIAISPQNVISATAQAGAGIDYANPVTHTTDAVLTAADLNKLHILSGNTPLTLTLPASVAAGLAVAVQIDSQSTVMHTIAAAGGTSLDGLTLLRCWAGELRTWRMVLGTWNKNSGYVRPMSCTLGFPSGASQMLYNNAVTVLQLTEVVEQTGIGLAQAAQNRIYIPRTGLWEIGFLANAVNVPTGSYVEFLARINGVLDHRTTNGITTP